MMHQPKKDYLTTFKATKNILIIKYLRKNLWIIYKVVRVVF